MEYIEFLKSKQHLLGEFGFEPVFMPDYLFDYQKKVVELSVRKGRVANFLDTGLGKTATQLCFAQNIVMKTNGRVLILTPLAVSFQFINEAEKIGINSIEHTYNGQYTKKIVLCNYERLHLFNPSDFEGVVLDESSILKNFNGKIKESITSFIKKNKV